MVGASFDTRRAIEAQTSYCRHTGAPFFAPGYDGVCFSCGRNVFAPLRRGAVVTGISVEAAGSSHVTGCPHCRASFID